MSHAGSNPAGIDSSGGRSPPIAPSGGGALFGLGVRPGGTGVYFVDDSENQLNLFS
jgi:hypothetical protein